MSLKTMFAIWSVLAAVLSATWTCRDRHGGDGLRQVRVVESAVVLLAGNAVEVEAVVRTGEDIGRAALLGTRKLEASLSARGKFAFAVLQRRLEDEVFTGRELVVHFGRDVVREVRVRRNVAHDLLNRELHEAVGPVALLRFVEELRGVHRTEQDRRDLRIDVRDEGGGNADVLGGGEGGVLSNLALRDLGVVRDDATEASRWYGMTPTAYGELMPRLLRYSRFVSIVQSPFIGGR